MIEGILEVLFGRPSIFAILGQRTRERIRGERIGRYRNRVLTAYRYEV